MDYWTIFCVSDSEALFWVNTGCFGWVGLRGGVWRIILGRQGWVEVSGALYWVGGDGWDDWGWVGVGEGEWRWVHCLIVPIIFWLKIVVRRVFHWQYLITYIFFVPLKFKACYKGSVQRVKSKKCCFMFTYTFLAFLTLFHQNCFSLKQEQEQGT